MQPSPKHKGFFTRTFDVECQKHKERAGRSYGTQGTVALYLQVCLICFMQPGPSFIRA